MIELLNAQTLFYMGFRLAPFILISFFALSSLFNSDLKGIIFLAMLLFNCFVTIIIGNMLPIEETANINGVCKGIQLSNLGPLSQNLPLNINIFAFTFAYLAQIIQSNDLILTNIPTVVVFSILILYQWYWSTVNECASAMYSFISLSLGFGLGWLMSFVIAKMGIVELQYFNGLSSQELCKRSKNQRFVCKNRPSGISS